MLQGVWRRGLLALAMGVGYAAIAAADTETLPEDGYLGELPVVLSVTRLAQSLADTPAAVTVIDRDMIRRSGARSVYDLLRFVPGFVVSGWNGANPIANYHMRFDEYGARLQVFVDGRSVYSSLYLGDTHRGLSAVPMEDIERIEVLRGSNSAAYGANAFLGVINIVTRNSADTRGTLVSVNLGSDGISDQSVRYGWGGDNADFRITVSRRADQGFKNDRAYTPYYTPTDDTDLNQVHFRGDLRPSADDEVQIELGGLNHRTGEGSGTLGNAPFSGTDASSYVSGRWTRQLTPTQSMSLSASFDDETLTSLKYEDGSVLSLPVIPVDQGGRSQRAQLEFSLTQKPSETVRTVWGTTWRRESATSRALFDTDQTYAQTQLRLFGNLEWRLAPQWLLNAGALLENNSKVGTSSAPRLVLNWQPAPEHTFRIGATKATRTPSLFELYGNNPVRNPADGATLFHEIQASGNARPERIYSQEIGYLGDFREQGITLDVRVFKEQIRGVLAARGGDPNDYVNAVDSADRGFEYQLQWRPRRGTRLLFAQAQIHIDPDPTQPDQAIQTPHTSYSAAWFQDLPQQWEMALMYWHVSTMSWRGEPGRLPAYGVTNARLARHFLLGRARSEVALTVQAIGGDHREFIAPSPINASDPFKGEPIVPLVQRRAFLTLRTEF
ncbi:MAG TPA: TonB-dependent receptor [Rhodocyclaceae bacterium]|nr:TonB-dependent receptor [Rhodocyclaceae bacterium]